MDTGNCDRYNINLSPGNTGDVNGRVKMKSAEETIRLIETLYPNWDRKFESLFEAIKWHTKSQDIIISRLRDQWN